MTLWWIWNSACVSLSQAFRTVVRQTLPLKYKVKCIEVPFITKTPIQPNLEIVYDLFPSISRGCLQCPNMEEGLLLGQNANILLPTGGDGEHRVDNLRVWRTLLGETGYVLEGHHHNI